MKITFSTPSRPYANVAVSNIPTVPKVEQLSDVVVANLVQGATLVYNANQQVFDIEVLSLGNITDVDGGIF